MKLAFILVFLIFAVPLLAQVRSQDSLSVRGPFMHGRLTLYLVEAPTSPSHYYLTLREALASGRAVVRENNSQTLVVQNLSDTDLFIQSGELIKGGQQDRMIASDLVIAARDSSPLRVYCIEK